MQQESNGAQHPKISALQAAQRRSLSSVKAAEMRQIRVRKPKYLFQLIFIINVRQKKNE